MADRSQHPHWSRRPSPWLPGDYEGSLGDLPELASDHPAKRAWRAKYQTFLDNCVPNTIRRNDSVHAGIYGLKYPRMAPAGYISEAVLVIYLGPMDSRVRLERLMRSSAEAFLDEFMPKEMFLRFYTLNLEPNNYGLLAADEVGCNTPGVKRHSKSVYIGDSIGPKNTGFSGTIAGFFQARSFTTGRIEPQLYALTCHHVLRGHERFKNESLPSWMDVIKSPSERDTLDTLHEVLDNMSAAYKGVAAANNSSEFFEGDVEQIMSKMDRKIHEDHRADGPARAEELQRLGVLKESIETFNTVLGVYVASGIQAHLPSWEYDEYPHLPIILDWGLVAVDASRTPFNAWTKENAGSMLRPKDVTWEGKPWLTQLHEMQPGEKQDVWKCGRSTGVTKGQWTKARLIGRTANSPGAKVVDHAEWVVYKAHDTPKDFSVKGDSGAGIVNERGHLCGMLWGGAYNNPVSNATYMTPLAELLPVIKKAGYDLVFPVAGELILPDEKV